MHEVFSYISQRNDLQTVIHAHCNILFILMFILPLMNEHLT